MQGFFARVFERDGRLLDKPCIDSIEAIRQVARAFKKVLMACSEDRISAAYRKYQQNDQEVYETNQFPYAGFRLRTVAGYLWSGLEELSGELYCSPGRYGSGATAERFKPNERFDQLNWPTRGDYLFPSSYHCSWREDDRTTFESIVDLDELSEHPVRVVQVPKTLKAPRTISVEPSYMMLRQQSVARPLMDWLESGKLGHKSIRFRDQSHNRMMAKLGSTDGEFATIDLSDASDLVSYDLVKSIFKPIAPSFLDYVENSRSGLAKMPSGEIITLRKFASMGSAMCFPIEAMVFFTVAVAAIMKDFALPYSRKAIDRITAKISVYGDDIIVPSHYASSVMQGLTAFGLRVNANKSFTQGYFRESCGGDYYKGDDVTPVYVRRWTTTERDMSHEQIVSSISLANQLYMKGYWNAAQYVRDSIRHKTKGLSRLALGGPGIHHVSVCFNTNLRWNRDLQSWNARVLQPSCRTQPDPVRSERGAWMLLAGKSGFGLQGRLGEVQDRLDVVRDFFDTDCARMGDSLTDYLEALRRFESASWAQRSLDEAYRLSLDESPRPYSLKTKSRWAPTRVGLWA